MIDGKIDYLRLLKEIFEARVKTHSAYSLRAFARSLKVDPGELSRILSGRKHPSLNVAFHIAERLALSREDIHGFALSVLEYKNRQSLARFHRQRREGNPLNRSE